MSNEFIQYELNDGIATITIDDGKRNALSPAVLAELHHAFERAALDNAAVILTGREGVFSAGFDLKVMGRGGKHAIGMLGAGYALPAKVMAHPKPVIVACNGHSFAMGVFLMLSADYVIGSRGDFKISANEVAIGMTMPRVAAAMLKHKLTPSAYQRAVTLAEQFDVDSAKAAGFFDEVVEPHELMERATALANNLLQLDDHSHKVSKRRIRRKLIWQTRLSIPLDLADAALIGFRRAKAKKA
ncbi:MAG: crotonase/enoyl-CoA hydratase family protein [Pseudomonadota bacterium]